MESFYKKFTDSLVESEKLSNNAEHLLKVVLPVVKDQKLLLRILENIYKNLVLTISNILKFEYLYKRISLTKDTNKNLEVFLKKCASRYGLNELQCKQIEEILKLGKKHKESGFEFSRKNKIIILNDDLSTLELTLNNTKEYLELSKTLINKAKNSFNALS